MSLKTIAILGLVASTIPAGIQWYSISTEKDKIYQICHDRAVQIPTQTRTDLNTVIDITSTLRHNAIVSCMSDKKFLYNSFNECDPFSTDERCFAPSPAKILDFSHFNATK